MQSFYKEVRSIRHYKLNCEQFFFMSVMFPFDAKQIHSVYAYYWDLLDIFGFPRHHPVFVFLFRLDIATYWIYLLQT